MENKELIAKTVEKEEKGPKEKVKEFLGKPIVKKIIIAMALIIAAGSGYAVGKASGSNGEDNTEEPGYIPDSGSNNNGNTTDYADDMTTDENDNVTSGSNESEGSAE